MMLIPKILSAPLLYLLVSAGLSHGQTTTTYTFPTTDYPVAHSQFQSDGGMVHGLCVLDASDATAILSPDSSTFTYTSMPGLKDGMISFGDRDYVYGSIDGNGPQLCEGGIYLQPSSHYGPPPGVDVTVKATPIDETAGVTICAFIEEKFEWNGHQYDRQGNWLQPLIDQGFVESDVRFAYNDKGSDKFSSYCKYFGTPKCPEDVKLVKSYGSTEFPPLLSPTPPLSIISQDSETVTVALNQVWDYSIDKYFFEYKESKFSSICSEVSEVNPGDFIETITIQCLTMSSKAFLRICLQDEGGELLSSEDDAILSHCCDPEAMPGTPTACYKLLIECVSSCESEWSEDRSLRGRIQ